jgi:uncharacterized protein YcbK (DUF882 family)
MDEGPATGRRRFLQLAAGAAVTALAFPAEAARRPVRTRSVALHSMHTGEQFSDVYWSNGHYVPDAMHHLNRLLRDYHNDQTHPIDPGLIDQLALLHNRLHSREPFLIISGYRSHQTNAMLASLSDGVAQNSFHIQGRAIDIRLPGQRLKRVRAAAMSLKVGGVGYYPHSNFVHLDTGPVRHW